MKWIEYDYAPKRVAGVTYKNRDGTDRQWILKKCRPGMPVELRAEPDNPVDPNAVAVFAPGDRQIGYLAADVAEWVCKWLGSGVVDFRCRIKSIEPFEADGGRTLLGAKISMTRRQLVPDETPQSDGGATRATIDWMQFARATGRDATVASPVIASSARRGVRLGRRGAELAIRPTRAALVAADRRLAALAEGNRMMLIVFRLVAAAAAAALLSLILMIIADAMRR